MTKYKFIFKLEIITALALIQKEVYCDYYGIDDGTYIFKCKDDEYCDGIIGRYPMNNTIIHSIDINPDYIGPPVEVNQYYGYDENPF